MKQCIKCGVTKEQESFYKHPEMIDGRLNKCIECCRIESTENRKKRMADPQFAEKEHLRQLEKNRRLYRTTAKPLRTLLPKIHEETWRNHHAKYPEKYKARIISQYMLPDVKGNQLHHWSYKPENSKDLIELTKDDHYIAHKNLIYEQSECAYKSMSNELLDTKDKHIDYLKSLGIQVIVESTMEY